ncbi:MAG: hypothetical protein LBD37_04700 [Treponema sp.]|jgi:hypothetical protein|nr:hypothetical protein [Treponema sp.]
MRRRGETVAALFYAAALLFCSACGQIEPETAPEEAVIPLPDLEHTAWRWADRPQGSITIKEFVVESVDAAGVQRGHLNCYRPEDPVQQVYVDWYSYDPAAKTGEIEYIGKFRVAAQNDRIIVPQYASYGHGAEFARIGEEE